MNNLQKEIKNLYQDSYYQESITDSELELASNNLLGFFKLLQKIDNRINQQNKVVKNNEDNRSTD